MRNKVFIKYICVFLILIVSFITLLFLTSTFSSEYIHDNVKESSRVLLEEGNRKIIYIPYRQIEMEFDNYTDALMINTAYSIDSDTPLYSAFIARKNYIPNITTEIYEDSAGELRSSSKYKYHNEVGELSDVVNGEKAESFEYARYWHGYLIFLRPLLLMFNITQLRVILTILLIILSVILSVALCKKTNTIIAIIFLLSLWSVEYFYLGFSLQGIFVFLVAIISSIILIGRVNKIKKLGLLFFITGMITNFFDFLTVPLVTLAMPLIIYFVLIKRTEESIEIKTKIFDIIKFSFLWGIGYGLTWFMKWLLVDLIFDKNMIITSIKQVLYRSAGAKYFNTLKVISQNYNYIAIPLILSILITYSVINLKIIISKNIAYNFKENIEIKKILNHLLPYIIIAIMPFAWYLILQNHSYYHAFFTYRNLFITVCCTNLCIAEIFEIYIKRKDS